MNSDRRDFELAQELVHTLLAMRENEASEHAMAKYLASQLCRVSGRINAAEPVIRDLQEQLKGAQHAFKLFHGER